MGLSPRATTVPAPYVVPPSEKFDGNDGSWSTHFINVGSPGQNFRVLISTSSGETWVPVPDGCTANDPSNCGELRGVEDFNGAASTGFQVNASTSFSPLGIYSLDLEARLNYTGNGEYGYDEVGLGSFQSQGPRLPQQLVAGVADKSYFLGHLGLSIINSSFSSSSDPVVPFFVNLREQNQIPSLSYGYTAGASYRLKKVLSSLILGGYDSTRFKPSNYNFTMSSQGQDLLSVGVQAITAINTLQGTTSFTSSGHLSVIDSTVPHLWFPRDVCDGFETSLGLTYDPTTDLYLVNDTIHASLTERNPTFTIRLGNSVTDTLHGVDIVLPYAAFDLQASYPFYANATNYFPIRRAANETQYAIGRTFLQEAYLIVDHERGNFSINQAVWSNPMPSAHIVTIKPPSASSNAPKKSGLPIGAIVGIAVGGVAVLAILIAAYIIYRRRRKQSDDTELADTSRLEQTNSNYIKEQPYSPVDTSKPQELSGVEVRELESPLGGHGGMKWPIGQQPMAPSALLHPAELEGQTTSPESQSLMGPHGVYEMEGEYYVPSREPSTERRPEQ